MKRFAGTAAVASLGLVLAACSGTTTAGTPSASGSPSVNSTVSTPSSGAQKLPFAGAPKVPNPLPESIASSDPCTTFLTPAQVTKDLGTPTTSKPDTSTVPGPGCQWANTANSGQLLINFDTTTLSGLSGTYKNIQPKAEVWKVLPPIQGFPAVAHVTPSGGSPDEYCAISIGIADDLSVEMGVFLSDGHKGKVNPCEAAATVAADVVTTLRQKAGA